jgi:hypothetical protein
MRPRFNVRSSKSFQPDSAKADMATANAACKPVSVNDRLILAGMVTP